VRLEGHLRIQVTLVVAVEVDLEGAADVRLVVGCGIERRGVELHRAVVARRIGGGKGQARQQQRPPIRAIAAAVASLPARAMGQPTHPAA
jgi:hypothetical protein